jgi:hypothetical protein
LTLPTELPDLHDVFHDSQLRKYLIDPDHVVNDEYIELTPNLKYGEKPISNYRPQSEGIEAKGDLHGEST